MSPIIFCRQQPYSGIALWHLHLYFHCIFTQFPLSAHSRNATTLKVECHSLNHLWNTCTSSDSLKLVLTFSHWNVWLTVPLWLSSQPWKHPGNEVTCRTGGTCAKAWALALGRHLHALGIESSESSHDQGKCLKYLPLTELDKVHSCLLKWSWNWGN